MDKLEKPPVIAAWHQMVVEGDASRLDSILADEVIFYSPVVHTPQVGKPITKLYLTAAAHVLGGEKFSYLREIYGPTDAALEFQTEIDGIIINGIDLITWNADDQIVSFKVMVRPLKAVNKLHQMMGAMLNQMQPKK